LSSGLAEEFWRSVEVDAAVDKSVILLDDMMCGSCLCTLYI